jgi:hypothetical protein
MTMAEKRLLNKKEWIWYIGNVPYGHLLTEPVEPGAGRVKLPHMLPIRNNFS